MGSLVLQNNYKNSQKGLAIHSTLLHILTHEAYKINIEVAYFRR
jgi:hypothetical protein